MGTGGISRTGSSPELNLLAFSHYLDALDFQRQYIRMHALLGGKNPHPQTYVVGGMASPIDLNSQDAINDNTLQELSELLQSGHRFVQQVYLPDLYAIAAAYPEWTKLRQRPDLVHGVRRLLTFRAAPRGTRPRAACFPAG